MPVNIQFEGVSGAFCLRNKNRQEKQHKDYCAKQHHSPYETKVTECRSLQKKEAKECANRCNIAGKKWFYLLCKRFPLVGLILEVIHIMERIVHCNAYHRASYSQDYDGNAGTEKGNYSKGEDGSEGY